MKRVAVVVFAAAALLGPAAAAAQDPLPPVPPPPLPAPVPPPAAPAPPPPIPRITLAAVDVHRAGGDNVALRGSTFRLRGTLRPVGVSRRRVGLKIYRDGSGSAPCAFRCAPTAASRAACRSAARVV